MTEQPSVKTTCKRTPFLIYTRIFSSIIFFLFSCITIVLTQLIGFPLKFFSSNIYRSWVDLTRQSFAILIIAINQFLVPTTMHIGGDKSVAALFALDHTNDNAIISKFGDRAVVIGNHQLYNDWMQLWWCAYTSRAHGGVFIMLKNSLKWIPILGWGMQVYKFIFLTRKWASDEKIIHNGLKPLATTFKDFPAWLIIFPEGTTFSANGVKRTKQYAEKVHKSNVPHNLLLPRTKGLQYSIQQLAGSIEYLYDATIFYEGIPRGEYGEEYYSLKRVYLEEQYPPDVSIYWRRYRIDEIPYQDEDEMTQWLEKRWFEKDEILDKIRDDGIESVSFFKPLVSRARLETKTEIFQIFSVLLSVLLIGNLLRMHNSNFLSLVSNVISGGSKDL